MPDIEIALTADELKRLQQVAEAMGVSVEQLAANELRARYALNNKNGQVIPMHRTPRPIRCNNDD